ncbi:PEP/pyruvate-binding domain-containing protein [Bacteroidota bacterium]
MVKSRFHFSDPSFDKLMQKRIRKVLIICSNYDAFMLEEDGRIDEQIFNEYVSLNLRYPPIFMQVNSVRKAFEILKSEDIDLIIGMLNIQGTDAFDVAKKIKTRYSDIPLVVLTHFSREISMRLQTEKLESVDHIFCWLGNSNLLLAIIKLIEDRMNADYDVKKAGVQVILFVEDSIRYISSYLPNFYHIIFEYSKQFSLEALNDHQQMLRRRGRPKILLAKNYEEAISLFRSYSNNIIGVVSDISFMRENKKDTKAGIRLIQELRKNNPHLPVLLQSSNVKNKRYAEELNVGFIYKYSKTLMHEIRHYLQNQFALGDFIFIDPKTQKEVARAYNLKSLYELLKTIPDETLLFHTSRDHFSKWLNARALFPIAKIFRERANNEFDNVDEIRNYAIRAIENFRIIKNRGIIAYFNTEKYDKFSLFTRIGDGSIGGKARGLAFIDNILKKYTVFNKFKNTNVLIPRSLVLCTDIFEEFMQSNNLHDIALGNIEDTELVKIFVSGYLSQDLKEKLTRFLKVCDKPLAVRSSSKLEDSSFQPFAGVYSTYMIPNDKHNLKRTLESLLIAIKCIYASVYFKGSKRYMESTLNAIDEEQMGIVIQELCGNETNGFFYPTIAGVVRSINYYPVKNENPEDGVAEIAYGLGKTVMEGLGATLRFCPKYPKNIIQLANPENALKNTQNYFYALDLNPESFKSSPDESINLRKLKIKDAMEDPFFKYVSSAFHPESNTISDSFTESNTRIITFSRILNYNQIPLAEILSILIKIAEKQMNCPVEIEFAVEMDKHDQDKSHFNILQIRPTVHLSEKFEIKTDDINKDDIFIYSKSSMGSGKWTHLKDIVYVENEHIKDLDVCRIVNDIRTINDQLKKVGKEYILIGPGRWGSADYSLGIPVRWEDISQARAIVELHTKNDSIEPSQGTHFFHNITSFQVAYFSLHPKYSECFIDSGFLSNKKVKQQYTNLKHYIVDTPLQVIVNGINGKGLIMK